MMSSLVSVIIPCYNQGDYLSEALDSVLGQTYTDWECIIINDGSTDSTEEVALDYTKLDQRFKYIHQENQGVIAARSNAIKQSHGRYILPLDGDDKIESTFLEKAVSILDNEPQVKLVYGNVEYFGARNGLMALRPYSFKTLLVANCFSNSVLFRRTDYDAVGGYNPNMKGGLEDWDFWISMLAHGGNVKKIDGVTLYYRILPSSRNSEASKKAQQLKNQIWMNHLDVYQREFLNLWIFNQDITGSRLYKVFNWLRKLKRK